MAKKTTPMQFTTQKATAVSYFISIAWPLFKRRNGNTPMLATTTTTRPLVYESYMNPEPGFQSGPVSEWATLTQDRAGWLKLVTRVPFCRHWQTAATAAPVRHQGHATDTLNNSSYFKCYELYRSIYDYRCSR